jgi:hypothetical protein
MVLKNRKRKAKVVRKAPKNLAVRMKNNIRHGYIKDEWDKAKSPADNLSAFGLNADPNRTFSSSRNGIGRKTKPKDPNSDSAAFIGIASIPREHLHEPNPKRRVMSEEKQTYAANCMKKYGNDYEKMTRDIKCNFQQLNSAQLKKQCEKFINLEDKERIVAIPKEALEV